MSATKETFEDFYVSYMKETHECLNLVSRIEVEATVELLWKAYTTGNHVWVAGNGGSATNAIHFACCLSQGTMVNGKRPLRCESLVGNIANFTATANDWGYEQVFVKQLENCLNPNDIFIAISCSGNSPNMVAACDYAHHHGGHVISLLGFGGGKMRDLSHQVIYIDNYNYGQVETIHISLAHLISQYLKSRIAAQ